MLLVLSACAGGGAGSGQTAAAIPNSSAVSNPLQSSSLAAPTSTPNAASQAPVTVQLKYLLASATTQTNTTQKLVQSRMYRQPEYISASNTSFTVSVTPLGGSTTQFSGSCTTTTCNVSFTATPGPNTIACVFSDASSNVLSKFTTTAIIQPSTINVLNYTANPVVNSVALQLASTSTNAGVPANIALTVLAKDIDNNTIVGNASYLDSNGNPVALTINVNNSQSGGKGTVVIQGSSFISGPSQGSIFAHYDGNWLASSTISVTSSSSAVSTSSTTLTITPQAYEYAAANYPQGITAGPDGNVWFTEAGGTAIGKMTPGGSYTAYSCGACNHPHYITLGPDDNLWFTEYYGSYIDKATAAGVVTRVASTPNWDVRIQPASDGKLWFASLGGIGNITTSGVVTNYPSADGSRGLNVGPNGNIWYLDVSASTVNQVTTSGALVGSYAVPNLGGTGGNSDGMVTGPDGNMWFANFGSNYVEKVTPSGTVTPYTPQSGANPTDIVVGPDGNLWFTESSKASIGRITTSGVITEYDATYGINASASPTGITVGPDGNIWFTEGGYNKVAKFVL